MVYHEIRIKNGKKQNYLVFNSRKNNKWVKKSKYIGNGKLTKKNVEELKKQFAFELIINKNYKFINKNQVKEIENLRNIYAKRINNLSKEEFKIFENSFFTELTYNSNAIEGSSLSLEETNLIINENISPKNKPLREIYEAKNHIKAIEFIQKYQKNLNERFILKIHSIILGDISERFAGRYREGTVRIFGSNVNFPESYKVSQLMKKLIYWYDTNKHNFHPFELAALFSMKFVTIHPFIDGNGRVSRLLMNFILNKYKYPWIDIYNKQKAEYLMAVRKANDEEYSKIIKFLIKTLKENLEAFKII